MKKHVKDNNSWDKKRLIIESVVAIGICVVSIKYGEAKTQIIYNGDVITYEIYSDTVNSINEINSIASSKTSGREIVEFALQYEGNPYLYGGTSLTKGSDASGFVSSVFNQFGFALPHSTLAIMNIGKLVNISDVELGDIICYDNHVAMYVGDGKVIHASNPKSGIVVSQLDYKEPLSARRIVE